MGVGAGLYMYDVVKRSLSLSHVLMSSCRYKVTIVVMGEPGSDFTVWCNKHRCPGGSPQSLVYLWFKGAKHHILRPIYRLICVRTLFTIDKSVAGRQLYFVVNRASTNYLTR